LTRDGAAAGGKGRFRARSALVRECYAAIDRAVGWSDDRLERFLHDPLGHRCGRQMVGDSHHCHEIANPCSGRLGLIQEPGHGVGVKFDLHGRQAFQGWQSWCRRTTHPHGEAFPELDDWKISGFIESA